MARLWIARLVEHHPRNVPSGGLLSLKDQSQYTMTNRLVRYGALVLSTFLVLLPGTAHAQIAITASDLFSQVGKTSSLSSFTIESGSELQAIVEASGENQTYDFTEIPVDDTLSGTVSVFGSPEGLPGGDDPAFAGANHVIAMQLSDFVGGQDSTFWIFSDVRANEGVFSLGGTFVMVNPQTGEEDTLTFRQDPPSLELPLPTTFGDSWSDTTSFFGIETVTESTVTGYGRLELPGGSADALRVRTVTSQNVFGIEISSFSLQFITKTGLTAVISLDMTGTAAESGEYTVMSLESTAADDATLPHRTRLAQNYPNPFNPSTTIAFDLQESSHVQLTVHDMLGRRVAVLAEGFRPSGAHEVRFDATDLAAGTYVYRLRTGNDVRVRLMTVLK